nr:uncharacterized protein LOC120976956 [Aegilops tauschii subsp. strangulata]
MAPLRLLTVSARTLLLLPGIDSATLPSVAFLAYTGGWLETESESEAAAALRRMARSVWSGLRMTRRRLLRLLKKWRPLCRKKDILMLGKCLQIMETKAWECPWLGSA